MKFINSLKYAVFTALSCQLFFISDSHAQTTPKTCGLSKGHDVEIVMMLDFTGSSSAVEVKAEKDAVTSLLDYFDTATPKPRVALGKFNTTSTIEVPLTSDYALIKAKLLTLPASGSGSTAIKTGLEASRIHLAAEGVKNKPKYIMLMSDGKTSGEEEVKTISKMIKAEGTLIFAIHYPVQKDPTKEIPGAKLMRDHIASSPSTGFYYSVSDDLPGKVREISINIGCEDGVACTTDRCNLTSGLCESTELDNDTDGIKDCSDKCPNQNDLVLGPDAVLTDDDKDGILTCQDDCPNDFNKISAGLCGCGVKDEDLDGNGYIDCLKCAAKDFSQYPEIIRTSTLGQIRTVKQIAGKIKKTGAKKALRQADKIAKEAKKLQKETVKLSSALPLSVMTCSSSKCTSGIEYKTGTERIRQINVLLYNHTKALYAALVKAAGSTKASTKLYSKAISYYSTSYNMIRNIPDGVAQCESK